MQNVCPLTGKPCYKPKVYQVTEIEDNNAKKTISLCEDCLKIYMNKKEKIDEKIANKFVKDVMEFVETAIKEKQILNKKLCPKCGISTQDITKTGKLGCDECWDYYYKDLQQSLYIAHGSPNSPEDLVHVGKVPKNFKVKNEVEENLKMKIIKLKYKLEQAVKKEDYEQATQLRDIIKELETRIV